MNQHQKLIQLDNFSELGWKVVMEYEANPIAINSEDEKRIHEAEALATRKTKSGKAKKAKGRATPYKQPETVATSTIPQTQQSNLKRPGGLVSVVQN